jgi:hypothetical protein
MKLERIRGSEQKHRLSCCPVSSQDYDDQTAAKAVAETKNPSSRLSEWYSLRKGRPKAPYVVTGIVPVIELLLTSPAHAMTTQTDIKVDGEIRSGFCVFCRILIQNGIF